MLRAGFPTSAWLLSLTRIVTRLKRVPHWQHKPVPQTSASYSRTREDMGFLWKGSSLKVCGFSENQSGNSGAVSPPTWGLHIELIASLIISTEMSMPGNTKSWSVASCEWVTSCKAQDRMRLCEFRGGAGIFSLRGLCWVWHMRLLRWRMLWYRWLNVRNPPDFIHTFLSGSQNKWWLLMAVSLG